MPYFAICENGSFPSGRQIIMKIFITSMTIKSIFGLDWNATHEQKRRFHPTTYYAPSPTVSDLVNISTARFTTMSAETAIQSSEFIQIVTV